jgi:hypothetical protein
MLPAVVSLRKYAGPHSTSPIRPIGHDGAVDCLSLATMATGFETHPALQPIAPPRRSGWVTTAAVVLLAAGTLSALFGLIFLILGLAGGSAFTDLMAGQPGMPEDVDLEAVSSVMIGVMVVMGVITLAWAAAHVAAGVGILGGHGWARVTGMVVSVLGLLLFLLALVGALTSMSAASAIANDPELRAQAGGYSAEELMAATVITSVIFILPFVVGYLIALIALIRNGAFFDRSARVTAPPGV